MSENYSYETSLPAYKENKANNKEKQCEKVVNAIKSGANNIKRIAEIIKIPDAIVSARITDLLVEKKIKYEGFVYYKNHKRKKIELICPKQPLKQAELFNL